MDLHIIRGTTNAFSLTIEEKNGEPYVLKDGEKIIFGVKYNAENSEYDIVKTLTSADVVDGAYIIKLAPEDTSNLPTERHYCDIGLQTIEGDYYMIIPCCDFYIDKAITQKEASQ